jgi:hypothetical protein
VLLRALQMWSARADLAIIHEELPWTALLGGESVDAILDRDKQGLIDYYRGHDLALVFVADLTDGLSRGEEPPQLRTLGRSILEPEVQRVFHAYVMAFVRRFRPEFVALSAETNLVRAIAPRPLYDAVAVIANAAADSISRLDDPPAIGVTVQVEVAWGRLVGNQSFQGVDDDFDEFPFTAWLGLSSYPYFAWSDPAELPADYYSRILAGRNTPVIVTEGGWPSVSAAGYTSDSSKQARYIERHAALLASIEASGLVQLTFTDLDLPFFPADVRTALLPFAHLGIVDAGLIAKPALALWDSVFALPLRSTNRVR